MPIIEHLALDRTLHRMDGEGLEALDAASFLITLVQSLVGDVTPDVPAVSEARLADKSRAADLASVVLGGQIQKAASALHFESDVSTDIALGAGGPVVSASPAEVTIETAGRLAAPAMLESVTQAVPEITVVSHRPVNADGKVAVAAQPARPSVLSELPWTAEASRKPGLAADMSQTRPLSDEPVVVSGSAKIEIASVGTDPTDGSVAPMVTFVNAGVEDNAARTVTELVRSTVADVHPHADRMRLHRRTVTESVRPTVARDTADSGLVAQRPAVVPRPAVLESRPVDLAPASGSATAVMEEVESSPMKSAPIPLWPVSDRASIIFMLHGAPRGVVTLMKSAPGSEVPQVELAAPSGTTTPATVSVSSPVQIDVADTKSELNGRAVETATVQSIVSPDESSAPGKSPEVATRTLVPSLANDSAVAETELIDRKWSPPSVSGARLLQNTIQPQDRRVWLRTEAVQGYVAPPPQRPAEPAAPRRSAEVAVKRMEPTPPDPAEAFEFSDKRLEVGSGDPSSPQAGDPSSPQAGDPSSPQAGDPSSPQAGDPSSPQAGDPSSPQAGDPSSPQAGDPSSPQDMDSPGPLTRFSDKRLTVEDRPRTSMSSAPVAVCEEHRTDDSVGASNVARRRPDARVETSGSTPTTARPVESRQPVDGKPSGAYGGLLPDFRRQSSPASRIPSAVSYEAPAQFSRSADGVHESRPDPARLDLSDDAMVNGSGNPVGDSLPVASESARSVPEGELLTQSAVPMSRQPMVTQVAESISRAVAAGRAAVRVRLHPQALGSLDISLRLGEKGLAVEIKTVERGVKSLLEAHLGQLHAALETCGVQLDDLAVVFSQVGADYGGLLAGENPRHRGSLPRRSTVHRSVEGSQEPEGDVERITRSDEMQMAVDYRV